MREIGSKCERERERERESSLTPFNCYYEFSLTMLLGKGSQGNPTAWELISLIPVDS